MSQHNKDQHPQSPRRPAAGLPCSSLRRKKSSRNSTTKPRHPACPENIGEARYGPKNCEAHREGLWNKTILSNLAQTATTMLEPPPCQRNTPDPSAPKAPQDDMTRKVPKYASTMVKICSSIAIPLTLALLLTLTLSGCIPTVTQRAERRITPDKYLTASADTTNSATLNWREFFGDPYLTALIDSALANNQELNIFMQEINISRNEIQARKGEYLPFVTGFAGADVMKTPRYTNIGAMEATTQIRPGRDTPDPLPNMGLGVNASWEIDIWRKLRNARDAAIQRYLGSMEGKNFLVTHLVAEIADAYYELLALDNQLTILQQNIDIQSNALEIVRLEKQSARVTELAVRRFEAEVLHTKSLKFGILQEIVEAENRINFLVGRYPQPVLRATGDFNAMLPKQIRSGLPSQLLANRPDVRQAEYTLAAAKLDVKVAKANFYPRLAISAATGLQAFNPAYLVKMPESILLGLAGDLAAPLINRNAIKANYLNANAQQIQAVYEYERTLLNAYIEVYNQLTNIDNLENTYQLKSQEVQALTQSIDISNVLFKSARADYMEVLLTQRDALRSKFELVDTKKQQFTAMVNAYQALGGGWR